MLAAIVTTVAGETARSQPTAGASPASPEAASSDQVERHSPREGSPSLGPLDAKTTLVFFMDFQCPVCPRADREMPRLVADLHGAVRVELHHNPLAMHRNALDAAAASRAAQRQGKFWEYHDLLLMSGRYDRATLIDLASGLGLDREAFVRDFDDAALREGILKEAEKARLVGADGTPGFLINGHVEVGWASLPWLEEIVRRAVGDGRPLRTTRGSP